MVPGTYIPISVNTINQNSYSQYYVFNTEDFIQYDGFTTVLTAESEVIPMETYHIKLAISDAGDNIFDSGVLLQASSFCSSPVSVSEQISNPGKSDKYLVYPVPAGDVLNIVSSEVGAIEINFTGLDGRSYLRTLGDSNLTIDISAVPSGIYFLRITGKEGVTIKKIYKK